MYILSIDHGTNTGYAVLEVVGEDIKVIQYGLMKFEIEKTLASKYDKITKFFERITTQFKIDYVVLEKANTMGSSFGHKSITYLISLKTLFELVAEQHYTPTIEVNPTSVKKVVAGRGRATKEDMFVMVCNKFNFNDDVIEKMKRPIPGSRRRYYDIFDAIGNGYYAIKEKM